MTEGVIDHAGQIVRRALALPCRLERPVPRGGVLPLVGRGDFPPTCRFIARTGIFFTYDKSKLQRQSAFSGGEA
jgi:hypothetical protein